MTPDELRSRRKDLGLSQRQLAEALGVTQHTVSRWEEGKIGMTAPRSLWLDVELRRVERERKPKRGRRPSPGDGGHAFVPLSGSQDTSGHYTRCGVNGCDLSPEQHERRPSPVGTEAEGS